MRDEETVVGVLKKEGNKGLSITEIVDKTHFTRSVVRILLAWLEGAEKVYVRKVGMAKLYYLTEKGDREND